jgi:NDP-sugar pyrophosphorylase family protein
MTLVVLAAGLGSRYGGTKQLDGVGPNGEIILDYSVYDAKLSGFDRVLLLIRPEHREAFEKNIASRFEGIKVEYAYQTPELCSEGMTPPERVRPWGTGHALLCCKDCVKDNFAVINADDFYGRSAFNHLAAHLSSCGEGEYCMAGYRLENTVTDNGSVSRGLCSVKGGMLERITEHKNIVKKNGSIVCLDGGEKLLPPDTTVSMTAFGFTPDFFSFLESGFHDFIHSGADLKTAEFYLPTAVDNAMKDGCTVRVYESGDKWFGVTYRDDRQKVCENIAELVKNGVYPNML